MHHVKSSTLKYSLIHSNPSTSSAKNRAVHPTRIISLASTDFSALGGMIQCYECHLLVIPSWKELVMASSIVLVWMLGESAKGSWPGVEQSRVEWSGMVCIVLASVIVEG